jgi:hypothetical protein
LALVYDAHGIWFCRACGGRTLAEAQLFMCCGQCKYAC